MNALGCLAHGALAGKRWRMPSRMLDIARVSVPSIPAADAFRRCYATDSYHQDQLALDIPSPKTSCSRAFVFESFGTLRPHFGGALDVEGYVRVMTTL